MALFRVLTRSYINEALREPGDVVDIDLDVMRPGSNLEPVNQPPEAEPEAVPLDADGVGKVSVDELRATLAAKGIAFDKRWGAAKLKAALGETW